VHTQEGMGGRLEEEAPAPVRTLEGTGGRLEEAAGRLDGSLEVEDDTTLEDAGRAHSLEDSDSEGHFLCRKNWPLASYPPPQPSFLLGPVVGVPCRT
jgi:hypothetical protein